MKHPNRLGDTLRITTPRPPSGPVDYGRLAREAAEDALKGARLDRGDSFAEWFFAQGSLLHDVYEAAIRQAHAAVNNAVGSVAMAVRDACADELDRLKAENARLRERITELGGNGHE